MKDLDFEELLKKALHRALEERGHVNILIAGRTGVGKSTLINSIFQGNLATTGQGRPVTLNTREIQKEGIPLSIFDTRGLEMAEFSETSEELKSFVRERCRDRDPQNHIHLAWVCLAEDLRRVESAEEKLVDMLSDYMPVIAVITKARADEGFRSVVQQLLPSVENVIRVRAIQEKLDEGYILPPMGLRELIDLTIQVVPKSTKKALTAAQKIDIDLKKDQSHVIVAGAAATAAGIAIIPFPFADAAAIVPIQISMISGITAIFGLSFNESFLSAIVGSIVTGVGGTLTGRFLVYGFFKFVPGISSVTSSLISATTAAALTIAFGEAYIAVLEMLFKLNTDRQPTAEEAIEAFNSYLLENKI